MPLLELGVVAVLVAGAGAWLFFRFRSVARGEKTCAGGCAACKLRAPGVPGASGGCAARADAPPPNDGDGTTV